MTRLTSSFNLILTFLTFLRTITSIFARWRELFSRFCCLWSLDSRSWVEKDEEKRFVKISQLLMWRWVRMSTNANFFEILNAQDLIFVNFTKTQVERLVDHRSHCQIRGWLVGISPVSFLKDGQGSMRSPSAHVSSSCQGWIGSGRTWTKVFLRDLSTQGLARRWFEVREAGR